MSPSNTLEIIIVVIPCTAMLSTAFFMYWYNVENAKLNKKIAFYKKKKYYPDDGAVSYWDYEGWTGESYSSILPQKNFPILYKNELFRTELKTRNQIFRLFKISGLTFLGSLVLAGLIMEFFLK